MNSSLVSNLAYLLTIAGLIGLIVGWFISKKKYKNRLTKIKKEMDKKLEQYNQECMERVDKAVEEYTIKFNDSKNSLELEKKRLEDKIKKLNGEVKLKDMEIEGIKKKLLVAKDEAKRIEIRLKNEYQEEIKRHKSRVSLLLNRIDLRYNKDVNDLIESLVTIEGNAIKEEAEIRYKLKDTKQRLENKIENLNQEIAMLKSRVNNLLDAKKINITIGGQF